MDNNQVGKQGEVNTSGSVPQRSTVKPNAEQGGGAGGYDADREQQEVNKEREDMNNERDLDELNVEKEQTPPQEEEKEENPEK